MAVAAPQTTMCGQGTGARVLGENFARVPVSHRWKERGWEMADFKSHKGPPGKSDYSSFSHARSSGSCVRS